MQYNKKSILSETLLKISECLRKGTLVIGEDLAIFISSFHSLQTLEEKLDFMYNNTGFNFIFDTKSNVLHEGLEMPMYGTKFRYGITVNNDNEANKIGWFATDKLKIQLYDNWLLGLEKRLEQRESLEDKKLLIDDEIEGIKRKLKKYNSEGQYFYDGYWSERSLIYHRFSLPINFNEYLYNAWGAAIFKYERELIKRIQNLAHNTNQLRIGIDEEFPIKSKLLLLYLYRRDNKLNQNRHIDEAVQLLNLKTTSVTNDYRELGYYINEYERLTDRQIQTWEGYNSQLNDPIIIEKIRQLKRDKK